MIKVYLEKTGSSDHIVSYKTEAAYAKDLPTLEAYAKQQGGTLTESVSEETGEDNTQGERNE